METSPAFFEGKSECRVRVFLESGFCTGPSPGPSPSPVRVSQYAFAKTDHSLKDHWIMLALDFCLPGDPPLTIANQKLE